MKIKSRFKDYYDYVAHAYGGGDPRVLYLRDRIDEKLCHQTFDKYEVDNQLGLAAPKSRAMGTTFSWLIVNGLSYTLVSTYDSESHLRSAPQILTEENFGDRLEELFSTRSWRDDTYTFRWDKYVGQESSIGVKISQRIKQPVFVIEQISRNWTNDSMTFVINDAVPILQNLHFAKFFSPEQMYQDIAYFVSNKMVTSPDLVVNNNMTDKEKIVQHGFDIRQSFRHRN